MLESRWERATQAFLREKVPLVPRAFVDLDSFHRHGNLWLGIINGVHSRVVC